MTQVIFRGNGTEYFKIWIVNILLTIITLGIYYPWAKVRTRRYFYGNTELGNANFDYHATGKQLFLSYLIAMAIFASYVVLGQINPSASVALPIILFVALPWIIWRGIKFNLRMTSYRNVRFGFNGKLSDSYATYFGFPLGMLFLVGIIIMILISIIGTINQNNLMLVALIFILVSLTYPTVLAMMNKVTTSYITNGIKFGQGQFSADLKFNPFFIIMLKGMLIGVLLSLIAILIIGGLAYSILGMEQLSSLANQIKSMEQGGEPHPIIFIGTIGIYALFIPVSLYVIAYLKARHRSYIMPQTLLDNTISFDSTLSATKYFGITFSNLLLIIFTAGLAYPWTAVRHYRYLTESTLVNAPEGFDSYMSKQGREGALGEELTDAFDIDVGGVAF